LFTEPPKEFAPLSPFIFIAIDTPKVDPSPDSKLRDPPASELDDSAMKDATIPMPDEDEHAVNSVEPPSAPDEADPVRVKLLPLLSPEPTVTEIYPPVPKRFARKTTDPLPLETGANNSNLLIALAPVSTRILLDRREHCGVLFETVDSSFVLHFSPPLGESR
jgi:hypothetical protein